MFALLADLGRFLSENALCVFPPLVLPLLRLFFCCWWGRGGVVRCCWCWLLLVLVLVLLLFLLLAAAAATVPCTLSQVMPRQTYPTLRPPLFFQTSVVFRVLHQVRVFQFDKLMLREMPRLYNHFKAKQLQLEVRAYVMSWLQTFSNPAAIQPSRTFETRDAAAQVYREVLAGADERAARGYFVMPRLPCHRTHTRVES